MLRSMKLEAHLVLGLCESFLDDLSTQSIN